MDGPGRLCSSSSSNQLPTLCSRKFERSQFFARTAQSSMVVLDEPDVYMHADLQRRLIRMLKGRFVQTIVATHSAEILSEVESDDVLVIDRECSHSGFAESLPAVQRVMTAIGTVHNLQLTRLWRARRFLVVEGDDLELLAKMHATLYPQSSDPLRNVPHVSMGGWGGWQQVIGSRMTLKNAIDESIATFCLLDRDYHVEQEVSDRAAVGSHNLSLSVVTLFDGDWVTQFEGWPEPVGRRTL